MTLREIPVQTSCGSCGKPAGTSSCAGEARLPLSDLKVGTVVLLEQLGGERGFRHRLMEMGLLPGTRIRVLRRADVGGVMEVEARGSRLSLRCREARAVLTRPIDASHECTDSAPRAAVGS